MIHFCGSEELYYKDDRGEVMEWGVIDIRAKLVCDVAEAS